MARIFSLFFLLTLLTGCASAVVNDSEGDMVDAEYDGIELTYFKLFDDTEVMQPAIDRFEQAHPGLKIHYRQFTDYEEYVALIEKELEEGEGPDIFAMRNDWFADNLGHIAFMPPGLFGDPYFFENTFLERAFNDLVFDPYSESRKIAALPLTVDTLVAYNFQPERFAVDIASARIAPYGLEGIRGFLLGNYDYYMGYSFSYKQILDEAKNMEWRGENVVDVSRLRIDPVSKEYAVAEAPYVSYLAETVSVNSEHPDLAWEFLASLVSEENLREYSELTGRPSSRRNILQEQLNDPVYGIFAKQLINAE